MSIALQQKENLPTEKNIDGVRNWLIIFAHSEEKTVKSSGFPYQEKLLKRRQELDLKKVDTAPVIIDLPNKNSSHVSYAAIKASISSFELLTLARKLVAAHSSSNPAQLGLLVSGFNKVESERIAEALISAALAAAAEMPKFKSEKQSASRLSKLSLFGVRATHGFKQSFAVAEGNALTRINTYRVSEKS